MSTKGIIERYTSNNTMGEFAAYQMRDKYADPVDLREKSNRAIWGSIFRRVVYTIVTPHFPNEADAIIEHGYDRRICPGGRYLYAAGRRKDNGDLHKIQQINNCLLYRADDTREGWARLVYKVMMSLMTGAGVGVDFSAIRPEGKFLEGIGGYASGPLALMYTINEVARHVRSGGTRRAAVFGSLNWQHDDIIKFIHSKEYDDDTRAAKAKNFDHPAPLDGTNISVGLDDLFFEAYHNPQHELHEHAKRVYWETIDCMLRGAEPGFTVDILANAGETLRNACTEITSSDDSDVCNLGHVNMARCRTLEEFRDCIKSMMLLLVCGSLYGILPHEEVYETREKNRRTGLGLMGMGTWLSLRGYKYGKNDELAEWLHYYKEDSRYWADHFCQELCINTPIKTRAIAPTGTTGIVCEASTGIEPLFCAAYKRRFIDKSEGKEIHRYQYVIDPLAKILVECGVNPDSIEDAYSLSEDVERRLAFQAFVQSYVDHGISSTINLPAYYHGEKYVKQFGDLLIKYLPQLRGITTYRDGCRAGQPLTRVSYKEAIDKEGLLFEDNSDKACLSGVCNA